MNELCVQEMPAKTSVLSQPPTVLIRSAGLPVQAARFLLAPEVMDCIGDLLTLDRMLAQKADALSAGLHAAIGKLRDDPAMQRTLLALRRGIFNGRPAGATVIADCRQVLDPELAEELEAWEHLRQQRQHGLQAGQALLADHMGATRRSLQALAQEPVLRRALALSNPSLDRPLSQYVAAGVEKLDRKLRRAERTLLTYLLRAVYKTSPLSTLTSVAAARLNGAADTTVEREIRCFTRPHVGLLARAKHALTRVAYQYPSLHLCLQPGLTSSGKRVRYWRRTEKLLDQAYGPIQGEVSEFFFEVQLTPSLRMLMDVLAERSLSVREITEKLQAIGLNEAEAEEYLRLLLGRGLLVVAGLGESIHHPEVWERTIALLETSGEAGLAQEIAPQLRQILKCNEDFATAATTERIGILAELDTRYQALLHSLGSSDKPPKPTLYEDSTFTSKTRSLQRNDWACFAEPLAGIQRLSTLFDPLLIPKVTFRSLFKRRYGVGGRCMDLHEMSEYFHETFYFPFNRTDNGRNNFRERLGSGSLNVLRLPEIQEILNAQESYTQQLRALTREQSDQTEVFIPEAWIKQFGDVAARQHSTLANSFFVQRALGTDDDPVLVLNHIYTGFGCMHSRYCYMFDAIGENSLHAALHEDACGRDTPEVIYAEIQGGYQTNLNQHPVLTHFELICPGENGTLPASRQIRLAELRLEHDPTHDEVYLFCERLGCRVVPLYLGMMHPLALPSLQKSLMLFSPPPLMGPGHQDHDENTSGPDMHYAPRLRSRNVILRRGAWTCSIGGFPERSKETTDLQYLLAVESWRQCHALPELGFFTILAAQEKAAKEEQASGDYDTSKPLFFDFRAPSCVFLLEKMIAGKQGRLRYTEALPLPKDAPVHADEQHYVTEFILEVHQELFA